MKSSKKKLKTSSVKVVEEVSDEEEAAERIHIIDDIYITAPPREICRDRVKGPRLVISHIVNENFKSYFGRQVLGPFHKCFTSIIGPNGSGKSNVIDSLLFVFGCRSSKIRSKKVSEVINNSDERKKIQSCKVAVHFKKIIDVPGDGGKFEVIPNSEFIISRTASKNSSSFYMINNRRVQFKEVSHVLRLNGVDLDHNRFLILQGEVETISTMKPKAQNDHEVGILEYLDDIIGTSRYKDPIQKLSGKAAELNEERTEKLNRVSIVEKDVESLEVPMRHAVQYFNSLNDTVLLKNQIYQKRAHDVRSKINVEEEKLKDIEKRFGSIQEKLQHIASAKEERQSVISNLCNTVKKVDKNKEKLREEFNKAEIEDHSLRERLTQVKNNRKKLKRLLDEEEKKLTDLESVPEKNKKEIEELAKNEERFQAQKVKEEAKLEEIMSKIKVGTQGLQEEKIKIQDKLINIKEISNKCRADYDIACSELKICKSKETQASTKLQQILVRYETTKKELLEYKKKLQDLNNKISDLEQQQQNAQTEYISNIQERDRISTVFRDAQQRFSEAQSSVQSYKSRGEIVNRLMEEKKSGRLPGLYGRLGDLGGIDKKYDIAVSTACGALDFIVVETVGNAQEGIEFLKRKKIGRATFIALEKQEHFRPFCNQRIKTPENVPRLFDLIIVSDDRVRTAFYYGLRDTLVAENLTQATRIAYGAVRYRVVTLKGELIEISGTMTGGGLKPIKGRMGQHVTTVSIGYTQEEVERMRKELNDTEMKKNNLVRKCTSLEGKVGKITETLNSMRAERDRCNFELTARERREPTLKTQLDEQKEITNKSVTDPEELARLTADLEKKKTAYNKAASDVIELEVDVKALDRKITEISKGRPNEVKKALKEVKEKIDKIQSDTTKLKVAINTSKKYATKSKEKIRNMKQEIENAENDLHKINKEQKSLSVKGEQLLIDIQAEADRVTDLEGQIEEKREEMKKLAEKETEIKTAKIEYDNKIRNCRDSVKSFNNKLNEILYHKRKLKLEKISDETDSQELPTLTDEQLMAVNVQELQENVATIESRFPPIPPTISVIEEYKERSKLYESRAAELKDITEKRDMMCAIYKEHCEKRIAEFLAGFKIIKWKVKEIFQMISMGGDAELECIDSDPYASGIVFSVRPLKKTWKDISKLSGGEKTLSSLALVFALHYYKPTAIYVMDEIDSALDFRNSTIIGYYIKQNTQNAQFIIVSLRPNLFELADTLIGIYKTYNCTKSVTVNPRNHGVWDTLGLVFRPTEMPRGLSTCSRISVSSGSSQDSTSTKGESSKSMSSHRPSQDSTSAKGESSKSMSSHRPSQDSTSTKGESSKNMSSHRPSQDSTCSGEELASCLRPSQESTPSRRESSKSSKSVTFRDDVDHDGTS